jgi:dihydropteroate synthase
VSRLDLPRGRSLALEPFAVMAIVNATPDSFYAPSRRRASLEARDAALAAFAAGAAVVDVGGESTRPGSDPVGLEEELERVIPAVEAIRRESDLPISVDTRKAAVALAALGAGADIVNDISALADPATARYAAAAGAAVVLMHMKGEPKTMQEAPSYADCASEVHGFLAAAAVAALEAGIRPTAVALDPGIGFGKRLEDNLGLLSRLDGLAALGYPLLVGLSRKSFIGAVTGRPAEARLAGSLGAACASYARGARIFRVHDVAETVDALSLYASSLTGRAVTIRPVAGGSGPVPLERDERKG